VAKGGLDLGKLEDEAEKQARETQAEAMKGLVGRVAAALDEDGNTVAASPRELNFVTATPVLFPQTPLVSATYRIEPDDLARPGDGPRYALIYVERTISDLAPVKGEDSEEPRALDAPAAMSERLVLLRGVKDLRWERFGEADRRAGDALPEDEDDVPGAGNRDDPARERRRAERRRREEAAREPTPEEEAARTPEERRQKWRAFARPDVLRVPAVRLVGEHEGEAFSWVFVIEALR
jgi:hypothetical protein